MPLLADPWFWTAAVPAILIVGVSKGGFGGGLGVLGVPILALVIAPLQAAAIMLPLLIAMDMLSVRAFWGRWSRSQLGLLIPAAALGIAVAALLAEYLDESFLRLLVGGIAVGFAVQHWAGRSKRRDKPPPGPWSGRFWGALAGFTSFVAHAGGPPLSVYILRQKLDKATFQATTIGFFTAVNLIKLPPYLWLGQMHTVNLTASLVLLPFAVLGVRLGVMLHDRVDGTLFFRIAYVLLFLTGVKLLSDGLGL